MHSHECAWEQCHLTNNPVLKWDKIILIITRVHPVHLIDAEQHKVAADLQTKPSWVASHLQSTIIYIHHNDLLLLSPKLVFTCL